MIGVTGEDISLSNNNDSSINPEAKELGLLANLIMWIANPISYYFIEYIIDMDTETNYRGINKQLLKTIA